MDPEAMPRASRPEPAAILYSTDTAFLPVTCISARSMAENCPGPPPQVTILLHDVEKVMADRAQRFLAASGLTVRFIEVDTAWCQPWAGRRGQSAAKFGLLRLPEWFDKSVERVVVVDSDTRFVADVNELLRMDLKGFVLGAVDDMAVIADGRLPQFQGKLGLPPHAGYFNSGLLVVDVQRWTGLDIGGAARAVFTRRPEILTFNDQCALNAVLAGEYLRLPFRWNHLNGSAPRRWPVSLIHYAGHFKPWNLGLTARIDDIASLVGRDNLAYYANACNEFAGADPGRFQNVGRDTLRTLSVYMKWKATGKFTKLLNRAGSAHLQAHVENHPNLPN